MTGPTTVRAQRPSSSRAWLRDAPVAILVIAAAAVALPLLARAVALPSHVDRISFENPTVYDIRIAVTDGGPNGWVAVGTARRGRTTTMEEILDQGDVWIFRFVAQGKQGGDLRLTREQLERDRWRVVIPARIGEELQAQGAPLPP